MKKNREDILMSFFMNPASAHEEVLIRFIDEVYNDFMNKYPFDPKDVKDYNRNDMRKHIVFSLIRSVGYQGYNLYEVLNDYIDELYNRKQYKAIADSRVKTLKMRLINNRRQ